MARKGKRLTLLAGLALTALVVVLIVAFLRRPPGTPLAVKPLVGIGNVRFGMSAEEVIQVLGKPDRVEVDGMDLQYRSRGFALGIHPTVGLSIINCYCQSNLVFGLVYGVGDFQGRTDKGIGIGSRREEIIDVYGMPTREQNISGTLYMEYEDMKITYILARDEVLQFVLFAPQP